LALQSSLVVLNCLLWLLDVHQGLSDHFEIFN
jgi:hypothetical protein